ncbi:MAG: low temperature requirement protein A [Roseicyclus sp.]|nr:low temperature requirement protein A [Roseicyclus sp.]
MTGKQIGLKGNDVARHANWLELFYDLIYVIVIARLTHMIIGGYDTAIGFTEYFTYAVLFVPVWWTWTGHTLFLNRFGRDTHLERLLTFVQMFGLILLAVFVLDGLKGGGGLAGGASAFALAYAFVRFTLIAMYIMAHIQNPQYRPLTLRLILGFSTGAALWAVSVFFPPNIMFALWGLGLAIDLLTPIFARNCLTKMPVHRSHLPERTGLLFIIVLGSVDN